jgi:glycosyltransferase involved in cell wall biosynthesis
LKTLNILFGPGNIASIPDNTMFALNKIDTVCARGIANSSHKYVSFRKGWTILSPITSIKKNPFKRIFQELRNRYLIFKLILWADVIVWNWDIDKYSSFLIHLFRKKIYIEWLGSDIRIPEIVMNDNPQYKLSWENGEYGYKIESKERSLRIQQKFKRINAKPLLCPEMTLYLDRNLFADYIPTFQPINLEDFRAIYPAQETQKPILVHTPSNTGAKGTKYVRESIKILANKKLNFTYIEITDQTREKALEAISNCDIFIDQFIMGGYGMASCEAMAMGKPVVSYIMPSVTKLLPKDCPIINTDVNMLTANLEKLIKETSLRNETGLKSRTYIEKYHNADIIARELRKIFITELKK